jgi:hypothetical protein
MPFARARLVVSDQSRCLSSYPRGQSPLSGSRACLGTSRRGPRSHSPLATPPPPPLAWYYAEDGQIVRPGAGFGSRGDGGRVPRATAEYSCPLAAPGRGGGSRFSRGSARWARGGRATSVGADARMGSRSAAPLHRKRHPGSAPHARAGNSSGCRCAARCGRSRTGGLWNSPNRFAGGRRAAWAHSSTATAGTGRASVTATACVAVTAARGPIDLGSEPHGGRTAFPAHPTGPAATGGIARPACRSGQSGPHDGLARASGSPASARF